MSSPPPAFVPLPVGDLVRRTYRQVLAGGHGLIRVGLAWLMLPLAIDVAATTLDEGGEIAGLVGDLVSLAGLAAIAVAWHRHVLLGEPLAGPMAPVSGRTLRYLLLGAVTGFVAALPGLLVATMAGAGVVSADSLLLPLALLVAVLLGVLIFGRLQLAFPAAAIGDRGVGLAGSWRLTRGNGGRLLSGLFMTVLPVLAAVLLAQLIALLFHAAGADKLGGFLALLAASIGGWLQAPLVAAFLSYAYLFFREIAERPAG